MRHGEDWLVKEVLREGLRNLTARSVASITLVAMSAVVCAGLVNLEVTAGFEAVDSSATYARQGGHVVIARAEAGGIDASDCDALRDNRAVVASGTMQRSRPRAVTTSTATPSNVAVVTGSTLDILAPDQPPSNAQRDVVIGGALAQHLGTVGGDHVRFVDGDLVDVGVASVATRAPDLDRWFFVTDASRGEAEECWIEVEAGVGDVGRQALVAIPRTSPGSELTTQTLSTAGRSPQDNAETFAARPTRRAWLPAGLVMGMVGGLVAMTRRPEMALYLISGASAASVVLMRLVEWVLVVSTGLIVALGTVLVLRGPEVAVVGAGTTFLALRSALLVTAVAILVVALVEGLLVRSDVSMMLKDR